MAAGRSGQPCQQQVSTAAEDGDVACLHEGRGRGVAAAMQRLQRACGRNLHSASLPITQSLRGTEHCTVLEARQHTAATSAATSAVSVRQVRHKPASPNFWVSEHTKVRSPFLARNSPAGGGRVGNNRKRPNDEERGNQPNRHSISNHQPIQQSQQLGTLYGSCRAAGSEAGRQVSSDGAEGGSQPTNERFTHPRCRRWREAAPGSGWAASGRHRTTAREGAGKVCFMMNEGRGEPACSDGAATLLASTPRRTCIMPPQPLPQLRCSQQTSGCPPAHDALPAALQHPAPFRLPFPKPFRTCIMPTKRVCGQRLRSNLSNSAYSRACGGAC